MKRLMCYVVVMMALSIGFVSCEDDEVVMPEYPNETFYDIATFLGNSQDNAVFELQKDEDSEPVRLTAVGVYLDTTSIKPDMRVLIGYVPKSGAAYVSDKITLVGVGRIFNDVSHNVNLADYPDWDGTPIHLLSMWRTGKYINIHCQVVYDKTGARFGLLVDETTIDNEYPDAYLVYIPEGDPDSYNKNLYASIDISEVWYRRGCKGINIHLNNSNLGEDTFRYIKNNNN